MKRNALALLLPLLASGCMGGIRGTTTARGATELLLVSGAAERAIRSWDASALAGRRVFLDLQFLECMDEPYVTSALRAHVARAGAVLVERPEAEWVLEARCASLGTWEGDWKVGLPPLPVSWGGPVVMTPELALGLSKRQGWAKVEVFVYDAATRGLVVAPRPLWGAAREELLHSVYPSLLEQADEVVDGEAPPPDDPGAEWRGP